jgi:hypothetical protein
MVPLPLSLREVKRTPSEGEKRAERERLLAELPPHFAYSLTAEEAAAVMGGIVKKLGGRDD